jgi:LAS superfamily LD-carboxypeptidase LdcB
VALSSGLYLSGLWPPFAEAVRYLQAYASSLQLEARVVSGRRSNTEQEQLYRQGRTPYEIAHQVSLHGARGSVTDAPPGSSAHNYGLAIDVEGRDQAAVVQLARQIGFGTVSWDPAHIEWPGWRSLVGL